VELQGALLDVLQEEVAFVLGGLAVLGAHDAGGPVQVEHVDQLLLLLLELLDLRLQVRVDRLQLLRLLEEGGREGGRCRRRQELSFGPGGSWCINIMCSLPLDSRALLA